MQSATRYGPAYAAVTTLFFAWGFITSLIDPLVASVKGIFSLSDVEAQLSASAFFIAYFFMSFPAAYILSRLKSVTTILLALSTMIAGCITMLVAVNSQSYAWVLVGLFILATGITALQVAANPLAASLGKPEGSHFRLTLSQTFNSLGTVIGPIIGAYLFLEGLEVKPGTVITDEVRMNAIEGIDMAYFWLAGMIGALLIFFHFSRNIVSSSEPVQSGQYNIISLIGDAVKSPWTLFGGLAIFLYVGAEVAIGTQMALFLSADSIWGQTDIPFSFPLLSKFSDGKPGVSLQEAAAITSLYWAGAMAGRLIGSFLLAFVNAAKLLLLCTTAAAIACAYVFLVGGLGAGFLALIIGLFNSIMFPVIFTLTLERSTASQAATSGFLCTSILGGALMPLLVGVVSQNSSYITAFIVPAICYAILCFFAFKAFKTPAINKATANSAH
jgi:FHS family L-fucose permease-like MFS transporter